MNNVIKNFIFIAHIIYTLHTNIFHILSSVITHSSPKKQKFAEIPININAPI